jgi:hypothetical protein
MPINIPYNHGFVDLCRSPLAAAFGESGFQLTRPSVRQPGVRISLQDTGKLGRSDEVDFPPLNVAPVLSEGIIPDQFYWSFVATFQPWAGAANAQNLDHVSLTIFQEMMWGDIIPCFRADWHAGVVEQESKHAQPHWHFTQNLKLIEETVLTMSSSGVIDFGAPTPSIFDGSVDLKSLHFAMSPLWAAQNPDAHKQVYSNQAEFLMWFTALTRYIAEQLRYACKKHSCGSPMEFGQPPNESKSDSPPDFSS